MMTKIKLNNVIDVSKAVMLCNDEFMKIIKDESLPMTDRTTLMKFINTSMDNIQEVLTYFNAKYLEPAPVARELTLVEEQAHDALNDN